MPGSGLSDEDITRLLAAIDRAEEAKFISRMESIGLDVTTQKSRESIRKRHEFLADWYNGSTRAKMLGMMFLLTAALGGVGKIFWDGVQSWASALLRAKGGG